MKFLAATAAALVTAAVVTPVPASAAPNPPRHGWHWKQVCKVRVHHGRRIRTCRRVRVRW